MLAKHMRSITEGKEKIHNLHYRWLDKMGMPVWINCRGVVIDDENGRPGYLIGCLNETGKPQRADNVSGLLGGLEFCSYLRSQAKPITHGFLMHIGIDNFGAINGASASLWRLYPKKCSRLHDRMSFRRPEAVSFGSGSVCDSGSGKSYERGCRTVKEKDLR